MNVRAAAGLTIALVFGGSAWAQLDLSGEWANRLHEDQFSRGPGLEAGEWEGLPMNAAARMKAESWDADVYTLPERQCIPFAADMGLTIGNVRIWSEADPASRQAIAWHIYHEWQAQEQVIWMDGRSHPPDYAAHTWQGFSTGRWEGDVLTVNTTHLKWAYLERNGVPRSDLATMTEHYIRYGDVLTIVQIVYDPVYLAEPMIRTRDLALNPAQQTGGYSCRPTTEVVRPHPPDWVPHHLPGANTFLDSAVKRYGIPSIAVRGGAETTYPEFRLKFRDASAAAAVGNESQPSAHRSWQGDRPPADFDSVKISVLPVQGDVYMLVGAGGNVTVQTGGDSVVVVDTQFAELSDRILSAIRQISSKPIRYVINTHFHADHTGGNAKIAGAGNTITGNNADGAASLGEDALHSALIFAHDNVAQRMSTPALAAGRPTEPWLGARSELFNGEAVQMFYEPAAHTDGDSIVFFRRSDVISAGDVFSTETYPVIDRDHGGSINGIIGALNHIIELAVPRDKQEGGTYIIPGHGRLCDEADVVEYRDMVVIVRDRVQDMVRRGLTLAQVKGAHITMDYDGRYGTDSGSWTTGMFLEAVYRDLSAILVT
jgi:glyoxylase-like metal-dependent hydrolase (beta-lactamase superfamily II)